MQQPLITARASETRDFEMLVISSNFGHFAVYRSHKNFEITELSTQSTSLVYLKITVLNATLYLNFESPLSSLIKGTCNGIIKKLFIALGLLKNFPSLISRFSTFLSIIIVCNGVKLYQSWKPRSSHQRCSIKKLFWKILQHLQKNICVGVSS